LGVDLGVDLGADLGVDLGVDSTMLDSYFSFAIHTR